MKFPHLSEYSLNVKPLTDSTGCLSILALNLIETKGSMLSAPVDRLLIVAEACLSSLEILCVLR